MKNSTIRLEIQRSGFTNWQIAQEIGVHETTLIRWKRTVMDESKKKQIRDAIIRLKEKQIEEYKKEIEMMQEEKPKKRGQKHE